MKLFELIGNTPLVELGAIPTNPNVRIFFAKWKGKIRVAVSKIGQLTK